jgi:hypothetical protein
MSTQDAEFAAGASLGATAVATASSVPVVSTAVGSLAAHAGVISGAAHLGTLAVLAAPLAPLAPFIAIGAGIYAIARFVEENG